MATATASPNGHRLDIVTLEMADAIEGWKMFSDGSTHIILRVAVRCTECGTEHAWYVNRNGRTRCADCDAASQVRDSQRVATRTVAG